MFPPNLPEAWEIEDLERMRHTREEEAREIAEIPLVSVIRPAPDARVPAERDAVVIITPCPRPA